MTAISWCVSLLVLRMAMTEQMRARWVRSVDVREVIRAVSFIWLAKLGVLAGGDHIVLAGACWLLGSSSLARLILSGSPLFASKLWRLGLVSFALFAPYFPDTLWAFRSEVGLFVATGLTFIAWLFVGLLCISLRAPLAFLKNRHAVVSCCLLLPIVELSFLFIFPLAHFGALPPPLPMASPVDPSSSQSQGERREVWVAIDPHWGESSRQKAALEAEAGDFKSSSWKSLPARWPDWAEDVWKQGGRVTIFFPETAFSFGPGGLRSLYDHIESSFPEKEESPQAGSSPELVLVAGVGSALENRIVTVRRHSITRRLQISNVALKDLSVPFFEQETMGYSVYGGGVGKSASRGSGQPGDIWFDLPPDVITWGSQSKAAVSVCYEGMFPDLKPSGGFRIVFTNTHLFSNFKIAALTYTYTLRLAALLRREAVLLVSNFGDSGLFGDAAFVDGLSVPPVHLLRPRGSVPVE